MFKKNDFSQILQKITDTYSSITEFATQSEVNRTYLSKYINMKLDSPPAPKILEKIADSSKNIISYNELMQICGYTEETIEEVCDSTFYDLTKICAKFATDPSDSYEISCSIEYFNDYINDLSDNLYVPTFKRIKINRLL